VRSTPERYRAKRSQLAPRAGAVSLSEAFTDQISPPLSESGPERKPNRVGDVGHSAKILPILTSAERRAARNADRDAMGVSGGAMKRPLVISSGPPGSK
jgi:hypothetical protein